jgi:cyclopropane-fatty-acyl-phospholipid synthase
MQHNNFVMDLTEQGYVPDSVIRLGIRRLIKQRLSEINADDAEMMARFQYEFVQSMRISVIAPLPEKANEQHYEVPADFFQHALGKHLKYSSCYWDENTSDLDAAEYEALKQTCVHAQLENGMDILELGCGWGSLTLWMAEHYPASRITAVSNSNSQREFILDRAKQRNLENVEVITCDMNSFMTDRAFDRVVSIEMFEHMRNYPKLFQQIHDWLRPGGKFFMHIFVHRSVPYVFEVKDSTDWMSQHFFSGGIMPSDDLPLFFQEHLTLLQRWRWDGRHYEKTANAWLQNMDQSKDVLWPVIEKTYGKQRAQQWWVRWRVFFMACEELFGFNNGQEWWVSHYLFERRVK